VVGRFYGAHLKFQLIKIRSRLDPSPQTTGNNRQQPATTISVMKYWRLIDPQTSITGNNIDQYSSIDYQRLSKDANSNEIRPSHQMLSKQLRQPPLTSHDINLNAFQSIKLNLFIYSIHIDWFIFKLEFIFVDIQLLMLIYINK